MNKIMIIAVVSLLAASCSSRAPQSGPISGAVLSADPKANQVVLDVGEKDGVEKGMNFVIKFARGGESTPNAKVIRVDKNQCVTTYPGVYMIPVAPGDKAEQVPETKEKETTYWDRVPLAGQPSHTTGLTDRVSGGSAVSRQ